MTKNFTEYKTKQDFLNDFPIKDGKLYLSGKRINDNDLTHILDLIGEEPNLRVLFLNYNNLTIIPENVFKGLTNLEELFLRWNELTTLPENAFNGLPNLKKLDLSLNELTTIPENVFNGLSNLKELYLRGNKLTTIPESLQSILPNCRIFTDTDVEWVDDNGMPVITNSNVIDLLNAKAKDIDEQISKLQCDKANIQKTIEIMKNN